MKRPAIFLLCALLMLSAASLSAQATQTPDAICAQNVPAETPENLEYEAAEQVLQPGVDYRAIFCTEVGAVYIDLLEAYAPLTVNNFVFLAENGYYNNTTFHRVIADFMVQGGDPTATGGGGPGYQFEDEFVGFLNFDTPGWLAMANAGPGTNGSQFFITTVPTTHLDFRHTIFGEVLEGQDVTTSIRLRDPATDPQPGTALQTVVIVTDPASVETTYSAPEASSQQDVSDLLDGLVETVVEPLAVDTPVTGIFDAAGYVDLVPEDQQEALSTALADNNFVYRAAIGVDNAACDVQNVPFLAIRYALDAYGSADDAANVLASGVLDDVAVSEGFAVAELEASSVPNAVYTRNTSACNDTPAIETQTNWQRGRYIVTMGVTYDASSPITPDLYLQQLAIQIFEYYFSDVLRRELR